MTEQTQFASMGTFLYQHLFLQKGNNLSSQLPIGLEGLLI